MGRQTENYVYGSAVRNWEAEPLRRREQEIQRKQRQQQRKKLKPRKRIDKFAVLFVILTFVAVMVIGVGYLHLQFKSTYLSKSVVNLKTEVLEMEKAISDARLEVENSVDLEEAYERAVNELGMKLAKKEQIITYKKQKSTKVRQHGNIPEL